MAKILITDGVPARGFQVLRDAGHELLIPEALKCFDRQTQLELIPDCEAVVACSAFPAEVIRAGKKLKIIANYGAGYDAIDIRTAAECGIPVTNIPNTVSASTAELAIALMLSVSRRVGEKNLRIRMEPEVSFFGMGREMGHNLYGRTLGIIGYGHIGSIVGRIAEAMGMRVLGLRHRDLASAKDRGPLYALLEQCDVVSLNCPLNDSTRGMMDAEAFAHMKKGSILINTARGAIVDTEALCQALDSGILLGAGLDVFPDEPVIPHQLLDYPNVVLSPHQGANAEEVRCEMAEDISAQILDALAGRRPSPIVNGL